MASRSYARRFVHGRVLAFTLYPDTDDPHEEGLSREGVVPSKRFRGCRPWGGSHKQTPAGDPDRRGRAGGWCEASGAWRRALGVTPRTAIVSKRSDHIPASSNDVQRDALVRSILSVRRSRGLRRSGGASPPNIGARAVNYEAGLCAASQRILGRSCTVEICLSSVGDNERQTMPKR